MYEPLMKARTLIFLFLLAFIPEAFPQSDNDELLLSLVRKNGQAEVTIPFTGRKDIEYLTRNVSITSVRDNTIYIRLSPATVEWFTDQEYSYSIVALPEYREMKSFSSVSGISEWDSYPTYAQYDSIMRSFATLYPSLCRLDTIGTSINGKLVLVLKISDNVKADEDEPEVFYTSTMHGDETGGFILMLRLAGYILKNYQSDESIKELADNLEIWINPLANPDGTYRTGNTIVSPVRFNANNKDLNRNFPDPLQPDIITEKETRDMISFLGERRFVLSANFHSGAEVVNYPWDRWLSKRHADDEWFYEISRAYADTVHNYSGPAYMNDLNNGVVRGAEWYVIYGGRQDFVTGELRGREVTIELDESYITPSAQLPLVWNYNHRSLLEYLRNALNGIHGKVLDSKTSDPVPAMIYISGHDTDNSQVYSDTLTGRFTRMLSSGFWDLTFSCHGYRDTTIMNIPVEKGHRTDLIVNMVPLVSSIDTTNPVPPVLYPNPASINLRAVIDNRLAGPVNVRIYGSSGMLLENYDLQAEHGIALIIGVKRLPPGIYTIVFTNKISGSTSKGRFAVIR